MEEVDGLLVKFVRAIGMGDVGLGVVVVVGLRVVGSENWRVFLAGRVRVRDLVAGRGRGGVVQGYCRGSEWLRERERELSEGVEAGVSE